MGYLKDIHSNLDTQAFPGAHFEIAGDVPTPQCSEAKIEHNTGETFSPPWYLVDPDKFTGYDLIGKICHITSNPGGNIGDFKIINQEDYAIWFTTDPGNGRPTEYYISDGDSLILTRNAKSFAKYIHTLGYAYTIKGGKLYTDCPSDKLKNACTILFDPLT